MQCFISMQISGRRPARRAAVPSGGDAAGGRTPRAAARSCHELVVGADPPVGAERQHFEAGTGDGTASPRAHHPVHGHSCSRVPNDLAVLLEEVLAVGDEHLVGTRYPGIDGVMAADLDRRGGNRVARRGLTDTLRRVDHDLGGVFGPYVPYQPTTLVRAGLVPLRDPAVDQLIQPAVLRARADPSGRSAVSSPSSLQVSAEYTASTRSPNSSRVRRPAA